MPAPRPRARADAAERARQARRPPLTRANCSGSGANAPPYPHGRLQRAEPRRLHGGGVGAHCRRARAQRVGGACERGHRRHDARAHQGSAARPADGRRVPRLRHRERPWPVHANITIRHAHRLHLSLARVGRRRRGRLRVPQLHARHLGSQPRARGVSRAARDVVVAGVGPRSPSWNRRRCLLHQPRRRRRRQRRRRPSTDAGYMSPLRCRIYVRDDNISPALTPYLPRSGIPDRRAPRAPDGLQ
mmetsp:Transcript_29854/g.75998  ORF Transcript_29854/g.75998 Transcript_29854/m.75998 type:complete len:245 (-) Transcript_29854:80-814(-)